MKDYREFLKADYWEEIDWDATDQSKGVEAAPLQKEYPKDVKLIDLIPRDELKIEPISLFDAIKQRKSYRKYTEESLTMDELSFLLWATQGINKASDRWPVATRTVPSGGCLHPFETYLVVNRVSGLEPGIYRYLPLEHKLYLIKKGDFGEEAGYASLKQSFVGKGAVVFAWSVRPYRTEWRYEKLSPKIIAQDSGHLCQNLYLACEAIGAGTCAIGAYSQKQWDGLIELDGKDEFIVYVAPVGKVEKKS
jgi:SagB-type dehydrogenase family enzyme